MDIHLKGAIMERDELLERLRMIIAEQMEIDQSLITESTSLTDDLGADSLDLLQIVTAFEDDFAISIPDEQFESMQTVGDALDRIAELVG